MSKTPLLLVAAILALVLAGCGGGGHSASVKATDGGQDPNFVTYPDAVPGQYLATYAKGAYKEPTDTDPGDGEAVAAAICAKYGATLSTAYTEVGSFSFASTETQARAMSHDKRVDAVEEDAVVQAAAVRKG